MVARKRIAVAVVERDGQFLVGQRAANVSLPGFWEFPGGKIELGETPEQAAVRECLEEAGISVEVIGWYSVVDHDYDHAQLELYFLACRPLDNSTAPAGSFRWMPRQEILQLEFPGANRPLLEMLNSDRNRRALRSLSSLRSPEREL